MAGTYIRKRATPLVIGTERRPASDVPRAPSALRCKELKAIWREVWRTPVAATWTESDHRLVMALCHLHFALETGAGAPEKVAGQIANLSTQLGLTPKARLVLSIETQAAPVPDVEQGRGRFRLDGVA